MLVPHTQHIYILNQHHTFCVGVCYWPIKKYVWRFLLAKMSECRIGLMLVHITEGKLNLFSSLPLYTHTCCFRYRNKINQSKGMICIYMYNNNLIWLVPPVSTLYRLQSLDSLEVLRINGRLPDWLLSWMCQQQSLRKLTIEYSKLTQLPDKYGCHIKCFLHVSCLCYTCQGLAWNFYSICNAGNHVQSQSNNHHYK